MKAITICQPHAWAIMLPDTDPLRKRVENRTITSPWHKAIGQRVAIHAGSSRDWMKDAGFEFPKDEMIFGAVLGTARLLMVLDSSADHFGLAKRFDHYHTNVRAGAWLVFDDVKPLKTTITAKGQLGLWEWEEPKGVYE